MKHINNHIKEVNILLATLLIFALATSCKQKQTSETPPPPETDTVAEEIPTKDTTYRISLLFAGDLMQHEDQFKFALKDDGTYDYSECFQFVKHEIESADIAVANFETTLDGPPYHGYPNFCSPDKFLVDCMAAGFDIMLTANNHTCDRRQAGLERTIHVMDSVGIQHLGTYLDTASFEQNYPLLVEKNGFRIAMLNYTYAINGATVHAPNIVNRIDTAKISIDIEKAKSMEPDAIIAFMHWGIEYMLDPDISQKKLADWLFNKGVTHIIGGHPHIVEPIEIRTDSITGEKHVLAYSLGNFISNSTRQGTYCGMTIRLDLEKDSTVRISNCDYSLYFVSHPPINGHKQFRIYPTTVPDSLLNFHEAYRKHITLDSIRPFLIEKNKGIFEREVEFKERGKQNTLICAD
ncbi:MAG: CapA family protein [Bacteroidales bacterium]|nr:CapA family protein [Bacteroidales bacterium]